MHHNLDLSPAFVRNNREYRGAEGVRWVEALPAILEDCRQHFGLQLGPALPQLSFNYVIMATLRDGTDAVLKLCFPDDKEFMSEIDALKAYNGRGAVRLLAAKEDLGAMVLERLQPGTMLATLPDEEATVIAGGVMRAIWRPAPAQHRFPTVGDWARGLGELRRRFGGSTGPFPAHLVEEAERLFAELVPTQTDPVILHGDLHHYNILAAEREPWLAIDPKGIVGEREFEPYAFLLNPFELLSFPDVAGTLRRRIAVFAGELQLDRKRVQDWALAMSVLSEWWDFEEDSRARTVPLPLSEILAGISV